MVYQIIGNSMWCGKRCHVMTSSWEPTEDLMEINSADPWFPVFGDWSYNSPAARQPSISQALYHCQQPSAILPPPFGHIMITTWLSRHAVGRYSVSQIIGKFNGEVVNWLAKITHFMVFQHSGQTFSGIVSSMGDLILRDSQQKVPWQHS